MKKFALYSLLALSMGFMACDEVEDPTGKPVVNEPVAGFDLGNFKLGTPIVDNGEVNLPALNEAQTKTVTVLTVDDASNLPEGYDLHFNYEVSANQDFSDSTIVAVAVDSINGVLTGTVTTAQLESAYEDIFGLSADPQPVYTRVAAYAYNSANKETIRLGGDAQYYNSVTYTLTPDPVFVLYTPGESNGWSQDASQQLYSTDGLYWCTVNTEKLTYTVTYISTYGVIGDFNN